jgi:glucosyl-dolichyl phosphate glucuronosyltransferase
MKLTVAICTWNRAKLLDQTLASMRQLVIPGGVEWELLVVNNNSTDGTDEVLSRHAGQLPLRRLFEPQQGVTFAKNKAVANTSGDLLVWTDDDVLVDPAWLKSYVDAASRWPTALYFGGMVKPRFEVSPPRWLTANLQDFEGLLVIRDLGNQERMLLGEEYPYGANMAFRAEALPDVRFQANLGRKAGEYVGGEETEVFQRLRQKGCPGLWVPSSRVTHFIPKKRMSTDFLWHFYHGMGRTEVRLKWWNPHEGKSLWGAPRWWYRHFLQSWAASWLLWLTGRTSWAKSYTEAARFAGILAEVRQQRSEAVASVA